MSSGVVLDVLLIGLLIGYFVYGYSNGFTRSIFVVAGVVAGAVVAFFAAPVVGSWVPEAAWRIAATIGVALALLLIGQSVGLAIGRVAHSTVTKTHLGGFDKVLGAVTTTIAAALAASVLSASVGALGVPFLSQAVAQSGALRAISNLTPDPVEAWLAEARTAALDDGIPLIVDAFTGIPPEAPTVDSSAPALATAAQSVVRITGTAYACGQSQSGTGFVVAANRVVTNAHVVAGVTEPVVETPDGQALAGRIVYFDPRDDLAVIAVEGLRAPTLPLSPNLTQGDTAVVSGYPYGGPFSSTGAEVISIETISASNIYGTESSPREVYTLAADVREGNSGGPLLTTDGAVAGVVFARSASGEKIGYAMTMAELTPVADVAPSLTEPASPGECTRG